MFPVHEFNDIILEARIRQLQFLQPCHLDLEGSWNEHFVTKAMAALQQMQHCHRPLDKLLCVDESSRLVCSMIGFSDSDDGANMFPGADEFFPPFLLLLIRTNPPHLSSTIEYCNQLLEGSWSVHPNLEILLSHLEACKQFVLTCTYAAPSCLKHFIQPCMSLCPPRCVPRDLKTGGLTCSVLQRKELYRRRRRAEAAAAARGRRGQLPCLRVLLCC